MFSELEGRAALYTSTLELFGGENEVMFATIMQNTLHPKNSKRTDAIKDGKYVEIETVEQANEFIGSLIRHNLRNELKSAESAVMNAMSSMQSMNDIKKIVESPDVFVAAVALGDNKFMQG